MKHLGILVTTYCNLNCRDCADLIPRRERRIYEYNNLVSDLAKVLEAVDYIEEVLIIGGEVLTYSDLQKVIEYCGNSSKIGDIHLTTNGVMMPTDDLLDTIKKYNVLVRVSGYGRDVAPKRNEIISRLHALNIRVHDLENMTWASMGNFDKRNLTVEELKEVFSSCAMKDCVSMTSEGNIYFCSRQMSAAELELYPDPFETEYVSVRNNNLLREDIMKMQELQYISTCDYCDGLSCRTKKYVPTAVQILEKRYFLYLISCHEVLEQYITDGNQEEAIKVVSEVINVISTNVQAMVGINEVSLIQQEIEKWEKDGQVDYRAFLSLLLKLINRLANDYDFEAIDSFDVLKQTGETNKRNRITIGMNADSKADLIISEEDIVKQSEKKNALELGYYTKLYIKSKFNKLLNGDVKCVICGLSYTQYGIIENKMKYKTVNLSVSGEDIPYSLLMARKALATAANVEYLVIPFTYYQGFYDMSYDDAYIHRLMMEKVNIPLLGDNRYYYAEEKIGDYFQFFDNIAELDNYVSCRDTKLMDYLMDEDYFNDIMERPVYGGLNFDYKPLSEEERYTSGAITANLNERIVTVQGYNNTMKCLREFMKYAPSRLKIVFFVPPMSKYLYAGYSDVLKEQFEKVVRPFFETDSRIQFFDWANHEIFDDDDFCDYEHLSPSGAEKLTELINSILV